MGNGYIFVYGEFKRGLSLYNELALEHKLAFVGEGLLGGATMYDHGEYPYVVLGGNGLVKGEVFRLLHHGMLPALDEEEIGFERVMRTVHVKSIPYECYVYVQSARQNSDPEIPSGVWHGKHF